MRRVRLFAVALAVLAACGSTVPPSQRALRSSTGAADDGVEVLADGGETSGVEATDGASPGSAGGRTTQATGRRASGAAASGAAPSTAVGPGVTADKIYVGLSYAVNSSVANAALGASGISVGDPKRTAEILIADINANGGIAGRKIEPVWHETDGASNATYDVIFQAACDTWTQDNKVFAAFSGGNRTMLQCLHNRGVVGIYDDLTSSDAAVFRRYPYYVELGTLNLDRMMTAQVTALNAQGYFGGWNHTTGAPASGPPKIGIVTFDEASWDHAVDQVLVPALAKLGHTVAPQNIIRVAPVNQTSDTGPVGAAVSGAVLRLRTENVTHVLVVDERGVLTLFFTRNADSQGYRPRYGFNSQNGPQALMDGAALPARQLVGSKGFGWIPTLDIRSADNPRNGPYANEQRRRCLALLESKGMTFADTNAESIAMGACTSWWFFRDAVKASGNVLNRAGFMAGVAKLGTSFLSAGTFANRFSDTQHDGVAAYRHYAFDAGCSCMRYTSGNIAAP